MADPLRRTLSKLRGRRSQRGAAGAGEAAGHTNGRGEDAVQCKAQQSLRASGNGATGAPCSLLGSQAGCYRVLVSPLEEPRLPESAAWSRRGKVAVPGEALPGATVACPCPTTSRREGTALLPPPSPPGLRAPPPPPAELCFPASVFPGGADSGCPPERGGGSDEDDYYDNQRLPGWGCQGASGAQEEARGNKEGGDSGHRAGARESTGRLRSQLQEAYYLLIHAMHDLPPASPSVRARSPQPTVSSSSRIVENSDVSSGDCRPRLQVVDPGCPGALKSPAWRQGISKSLESLPASPSAQPLPLPRCRSDSALRSLLQEPPAPQGHLLQDPGGPRREEAGSPAAASERSGGNGCRRCRSGRIAGGGLPSALGDGVEQLLLPKFDPEPDAALGKAVPLGGTVVDPATAEGGQSSRRHPLTGAHDEGPFKPPAVTVRKLQKWMYKGRLLSLGMKGRGSAAGPSSPSPSKASGTRGLLLGREEGSTVPSSAHMRGGPFSKALVSPSDQRILLTA
ncbi:UNVERIFIED_CONTAM: hypothetical protein K2H54_000803 [Gekko kuhli]